MRNLEQTRFERLLVLSMAEVRAGKRLWLCRCDCGVERVVYETHLLRGNTRSCGCIGSEITARRNVEACIHGKWRTNEFNIWQGMEQRCRDKNSKAWPRYGGLGIQVCESWANSFEAFLNDVGPRPSTNHTLDRRDNSGHYEPGNVRWATRTEQQNNRTNTRFGYVDGQPLPAAEICRRFGISKTTISRRLKDGLKDDALIAPPRKKRKSERAPHVLR